MGAPPPSFGFTPPHGGRETKDEGRGAPGRRAPQDEGRRTGGGRPMAAPTGPCVGATLAVARSSRPRRGRRPRRPGQTINGLEANKRRRDSCGMVGTSQEATAIRSCRPYAEGRQPDSPRLHADTSCTNYRQHKPLETYRRRTFPSVFPAPFHVERGAAGDPASMRKGPRPSGRGPFCTERGERFRSPYPAGKSSGPCRACPRRGSGSRRRPGRRT